MNSLIPLLLLRDVPFWTATTRRRWLRRLAALAYVYVGVFAVLLWLENRMLFAGAHSGREWEEPPSDLKVHEFDLPIAGGGSVAAWFTAPEGWGPERGAVLYSHGNGGNLSDRGEAMRLFRDRLGRAVLGHEYPGYGRSPGPTTEAGLYASGDAAYEWLLRDRKVPAGEVVLVGESLGGAVAIDLATRHEHRMLVTLGAFASFPDMAQTRFPWLPARYFVRNQFDNLRKIERARGPSLLVHGTRDVVVPFSQGEKLAAAAPGPKRVLVLPGGGHNCLFPEREEFWKELRSFLDETRPPR